MYTNIINHGKENVTMKHTSHTRLQTFKGKWNIKFSMYVHLTIMNTDLQISSQLTDTKNVGSVSLKMEVCSQDSTDMYNTI